MSVLQGVADESQRVFVGVLKHFSHILEVVCKKVGEGGGRGSEELQEGF